jgi:hypothetical protein
MILEIMQQLQIHEPVMISSRTGYGIHKLKNRIIGGHPKAALG